LRQDVPGHGNAFDDLVDVVVGRKLLVMDHRRRHGIGGLQRDPSAIAGAHQPDQGRDRCVFPQHEPALVVEVEREGGEGQLEVGGRQARAALHERLGVADGRAERTLPR
jgi:hypothetical protein